LVGGEGEVGVLAVEGDGLEGGEGEGRRIEDQNLRKGLVISLPYFLLKKLPHIPFRYMGTTGTGFFRRIRSIPR